MQKKLSILITLSRIKMFHNLYNSKEILDKIHALELQQHTTRKTIHETLEARERSFLSGERTYQYDGFLKILRTFEKAIRQETQTLKQRSSENYASLERLFKQQQLLKKYSLRKYNSRKHCPLNHWRSILAK